MPLEIRLSIVEVKPGHVTVGFKGGGVATVEESAVAEVVRNALGTAIGLMAKNDPRIQSVLSIERNRFERIERGGAAET